MLGLCIRLGVTAYKAVNIYNAFKLIKSTGKASLGGALWVYGDELIVHHESIKQASKIIVNTLIGG